MGEANSEDRFHLFSRLPTELRLEVWQFALPQEFEDRAVVSFYQDRCWQHRRQRQQDRFPDPDRAHQWVMEFDHKLLDRIPVYVSLFYTSQEARNVTITWALEQGLEPQLEQGKPRLMRPVRPSRDILHIASLGLTEGLEQRQFHPDLLNQTVFWAAPALTGISTTAAAIQEDVTSLYWLWNIFKRAKTIFVIVGEEPQEESEHRWELIDANYPIYTWSFETQRFHCENMYDGTQEADFLLMDVSKAGDKLGDALAIMLERSCEIRLARAVRC